MFGLNILSANMHQLLYYCFSSSLHTDYKKIGFYLVMILKSLDKCHLIFQLKRKSRKNLDLNKREHMTCKWKKDKICLSAQCLTLSSNRLLLLYFQLICVAVRFKIWLADGFHIAAHLNIWTSHGAFQRPRIQDTYCFLILKHGKTFQCCNNDEKVCYHLSNRNSH